jgi:hypothetical protein
MSCHLFLGARKSSCSRLEFQELEKLQTLVLKEKFEMRKRKKETWTDGQTDERTKETDRQI